jgi:hypothetical protein
VYDNTRRLKSINPSIPPLAPTDRGSCRIDPAAPLVHLIIMRKLVLWLCAIICAVLSATQLPAQQRRIQSDESTYGSRFFEQLRTIFGRFQNSDLQRVFGEAQPIQCSELVGRKGEWRPVAFFNEDRALGDWFRESLEEVKTDVAVYTFKGACGDQGKVQVATEFPTDAGIEDYNARKIELDQMDVMVNDPVNAVLDPKTMAYKFDLPYLFLKQRAPRRIYSLTAPDRNSAYAADVANRWECKAVSSKDVTYRFLICRVSIVPQGRLPKNETWEPTFGSSAFFILSDGTEAKSSVNLSFGDAKPKEEEPSTPAPDSPPRPTLKRK